VKKAGEVFDNVCDYDDEIEKVVPHYCEIHQTIIDSLPFEASESFSLLELGTGTGNLAAKLLARFTNIKYAGLDYSEKMLKEAISKLRKHNTHISLKTGNLIDLNYDKRFDCIVSCLVIHHLTDEEKKKVFKRVFSLLRKPGFFINADPVKSHIEHIANNNQQNWFDWMRANGLTESEIMERHRSKIKLDKNSGLAEQMEWLKETGFWNTEIVWKRFDKAIFCAMRK
jgi:tRNA (cmo5U34)-methyltransferase